MAWLGYLRWDGVEIANDDRLQAYLDSHGITWIEDLDTCGQQALDVLGIRGWNTVPVDVGYRSPSVDPAPWFDAYAYDSQKFLGTKLLSIDALDDSSREVTITETASSAGTVTGRRRASREFVVRLLLVGLDRGALQYGLGWLTTTLQFGDTCKVGTGTFDLVTDGVVCDYLIECPTQAGNEWRKVMDVHVTDGPDVLSTRIIEKGDCAGGGWMEVQFTVTALNPGVWHDEIDFTKAGVGIDYGFVKSGGGWQFYRDETSVADDNDLYQAPLYWEYPHTYAGMFGSVQKKATIPAGALAVPGEPAVLDFVTDPSCPTPPGFPGNPSSSILCSPAYTGGYESYIYAFRNDLIPSHIPVAPIVEITTGDTQLQQLRFRLEYSGTEVYAFEVSYVPANMLMRVDSTFKRTDLWDGSRWLSGGHLVRSLGGAETFRYQELLCPDGLVMYVDYPTELGNPYPAQNVQLFLMPRDS